MKKIENFSDIHVLPTSELFITKNRNIINIISHQLFPSLHDFILRSIELTIIFSNKIS